MKEVMVKDVKSILKERNHEQTYRPFYNDKRKDGRRIKMPFQLDADTAAYLQQELTKRFPAYDISVADYHWESHWFYQPSLVTTVHIKNK
jgi:hypothetical protein